ncbi:MAG: hypothetical protein ACOZIN_09375 [Myxococcota bacterium]
MTHSGRLSFTLALSALVSACAHKRLFPTPETLAKLAAAPPPRQMFKGKQVRVDSWKLTGPLPDKVGLVPHKSANPWDALVEERVQAKPGVLIASEEMHCAARELGIFALEHGNLPASELSRFIFARCGTSGAAFGTNWMSGEVSDQVSDAEMFARWSPQVKQMLAELSGSRALGVWVGRKAGKGVVMVASTQRRVHLEPLTMVPGEDGVLWVRGELLVPAEKLMALHGKGRFGVDGCERDESLALPKFSFRCSLEKTDASAWIDISTFQTHRILGETAVELLAWPSGALSDTYERSMKLEPRPIGDFSVFTTLFHATVNQVRAKAGLPALELSARQSDTAARVAPHYFAAMVDSDESALDTVALGMMAGWDVEGPVFNGNFGSSSASGSVDASLLVEDFVSRPYGRKLLLDAEVSQLAVGPVRDETNGVTAAIVSSYVLRVQPLGVEEQKKVLAQVNEARKKAGVEPVLWVAAPPATAERISTELAHGQMAPEEALDVLLQDVVGQVGYGIFGWSLETYSLEDIKVPDELATQPAIGLIVAVGRYRPRGDPWHRYVVLLVRTRNVQGPSA